MRKYQNFTVWKKSRILIKLIYEITGNFPKAEMFGLCAQMRRCSISIASNIAEGSGRLSQKDFRHFLIIAYGSCAELETQILISYDLHFINEKASTEMLMLNHELMKMLRAFIAKL